MTNLREIEGIGPVYAEKLEAIGINSLEELLDKGAHTKDREDIAEKAGLTYQQILEWVNRADLFRIKGVGSEYSDLLETAGVDTVLELAQRNSANLTAKMAETDGKTDIVRRLPTETEVTDWIAQAKGMERKVWYEGRTRRLVTDEEPIVAVVNEEAGITVTDTAAAVIKDTTAIVVDPVTAEVTKAEVIDVAPLAAVAAAPLIAAVAGATPVAESVTPVVAVKTEPVITPPITPVVAPTVTPVAEIKAEPLVTPTATPIVAPVATPVTAEENKDDRGIAVPLAAAAAVPLAAALMGGTKKEEDDKVAAAPDCVATAPIVPPIVANDACSCRAPDANGHARPSSPRPPEPQTGPGSLRWPGRIGSSCLAGLPESPSITEPAPATTIVTLSPRVARPTDAIAPVAAVTGANEILMLFDGGTKEWIEPAAAEFNKKNDGKIKIVLTKMGSREGRDQILYDKDKVHPVLWSPADIYWVDKIKRDAADASLPSKSGATTGDAKPLLKTYLTLLMPEEKAKVFDAAMQKTEYAGKTWKLMHDLATKGWTAAGGPADWGKLKLAQTDPTKSNSAMAGLTLMYQEFARANPGKSINDKDFLTLMGDVEGSVASFAPATSDLIQSFVSDPGKADMAIVYESDAIRAVETGAKGMRVIYPSPTIAITVPATVSFREPG